MVGIAFTGTSESSDLDSSGEIGAQMTFSSDHTSIAVVEVTSRPTYRKDINEKYV